MYPTGRQRRPRPGAKELAQVKLFFTVVVCNENEVENAVTVTTVSKLFQLKNRGLKAIGSNWEDSIS